MKRRVFVPTADRFVSVEDGTVRDLDGTELGRVDRDGGTWEYSICDGELTGGAVTQVAALAALLADPSCPTPGPNRYDR